MSLLHLNVPLHMRFTIKLVFAITLLLPPVQCTFAQESHTITLPFSYNTIILPGEEYHELIGDSVYFSVQDTTFLYDIDYFNKQKNISALPISKLIMIIDSITLIPRKEIGNNKSSHNKYYLRLNSINSDFSIGIRISLHQLDRQLHRKFTLIRKSVYDAFKLHLMKLVFDTGISINLNTTNGQPDTSDDYDDVVFQNLSKIDTHDVKRYHMDSLSYGWRVKKILIQDTEDLFNNTNSTNSNGACSNYETEIAYGLEHICLLTENYMGHSQMVQISQLNENQYISEIPLIKQTIRYRKKYGNIQWQKSRFLLNYYNIVDAPEHDSDSETKSGYLEPVISNNRISYFKNASLLTFSLRYRDYTKKKVSFTELYRNHFHLLSAYNPKFDESKHSLKYIIRQIRKDPRFKDIKISDRITILTYHMIFGSSFTDFAFIRNSYFSDS